MSTAIPTSPDNQLVRDIMKHLRKSSHHTKQINEGDSTTRKLQQDVFSKQVWGILNQLDDNVCLVEFFDRNREPIDARSFVNRGSLRGLTESIIGNGLTAGARYLVILRNRKSGEASPRSHDRQLIGYLLSGLDILEITLLDYIITGDGMIFSALLAGSLKNQGQKPAARTLSLVPVGGGL